MDARAPLPEGTLLDGTYRIIRLIGAGGFGITYLAGDLSLETTIAIKEYFPEQFGHRDSSQSVRPSAAAYDATFTWGRNSFLREARTLARFRHPSIVQVTRVFEANATAYMVMAFEQGQSFEDWLKQLGRPPTQTELDDIVAPLLDALDLMHAQSFLHRDIAPDNIIVRADGTPVLLDFGAARRAVAEQTKALTGLVKSGYSPQEQYATDGRLQGPWTDVYALGATLYRAVTGQPPEEATMRVIEDRLVPAAKAAAGAYRASFLAAIGKCLKVRPSERPQSVAEIKPALLGDARSPRREGKVSPIAGSVPRRWIAAAGALALVAGLATGGVLWQRSVEAQRQAELALKQEALEKEQKAARQREQEALKQAEAAAKEKAEEEARQKAEQAARERAAAEEAERKAEAESQDRPVSLQSLHDYAGIWAPEGVDCGIATSGELDNESRATSGQYELVGICDEGFQIMYAAHFCSASMILRRANTLQLSADCELKGSYFDRIRLFLETSGDSIINFDKSQFDAANFYIEGKYKRCSRSYACYK